MECLKLRANGYSREQRMYDYLRLDIQAYYNIAKQPKTFFVFRRLLSERGLKFVLLARIQLKLSRKGHHLAARLVHLLNLRLTGGEMSMTVELGQRLVVKHPMGVLIGENVVIGNDVTILKGATFGKGDVKSSEHAKRTIISDHCVIGTNAVILDGVNLGANCSVGANAVVTKSFGENSILLGVPAKNFNGKSIDGIKPTLS
jgi:serine O-acetyltransferase